MSRSPLSIVGICALVLLVPGAGCTFNVSGVPWATDGGADSYVPPTCGNGVWDDEDGEACDGVELGGQTCETLGYTGGTLACTPNCTLDESQCEAPVDCGNGVLDPDEQCDDAELGGATCDSVTALPEGELSCTGSCQLDASQCHDCGDGSIDGPEDCDDTNLGGLDCVALGHVWGDLTCQPDCRFDVTGCFDYPANWYDTSCPYRKSITIDASNITAALTQFPVLVQRSDPDLAAHALPTGGDIHFANASGAPLPHELEFYDGVNGDLVAWVGVDFVSDATPTVLYMYYGAAACNQPVNAADVWDAGYRGVWHLAELGTGTRLDSTSNMLDASTAGYNGDEAVTGLLDGADLMDGVDDHLLLPLAATGGLGDFTLCFWIRTTESGIHPSIGWRNPTLIGNVSTGYYSGDFGIETTGGTIGMRSGLCSTIDELLWSPFTINDDQWHYICAVAESTTIDLFVDNVHGVQVCGGARTVSSPAFWVAGHSASSATNEGDYHQGVYDELRISGMARLPAWRFASYVNQSAPSAFYAVGSEEALP